MSFDELIRSNDDITHNRNSNSKPYALSMRATTAKRESESIAFVLKSVEIRSKITHDTCDSTAQTFEWFSTVFFSLSIGVHIKHEFDQIMSISYTISPSQCELRWRFAWNSFNDMFRRCSSSNRISIPSFHISFICILSFDRISRKCQRNAAAPIRIRVCVFLLFTKHLSIKTNLNFTLTIITHKTTPDQAVIICQRCRSEYMLTVHLLLKYWHDAPMLFALSFDMENSHLDLFW